MQASWRNSVAKPDGANERDRATDVSEAFIHLNGSQSSGREGDRAIELPRYGW
ncbi:hypothetical protein [Rubidibacter lacunae]|uniref:hypothetical protein n=1 Tax=Rubidibacter lacunae TaxID=582514 RepID=UPI0003FB5DD5|nr:hypothetical protein [Rubidibacter lacunae]